MINVTTQDIVSAPAERRELKFRLWSNKYDMWWRPDGWGYTPDSAEAGQFTEAEAVRNVVRSAMAGEVGKATLMVVVFPSTEEPERTLTAVEDHAEPVPYDATVEDRHEHGYTFREGLGYLPDDAECPGCCELATERWKAAWKRPVTDAAEVSDDMADKAAQAEEL